MGEHFFTAQNICDIHRFIWFMSQFQIAWSIGHTVGVMQCSGNDSGVCITGKHTNDSFLAGNVANGTAKGRKKQRMGISLDIRAVSGNGVKASDSRNQLFCLRDSSGNDILCAFRSQWGNQAHIDPDVGFVWNHIGTISTVYHTEGNRGIPQFFMNGSGKDLVSYPGDNLCDPGNGISAFIGSTGMGSYAFHRDLEPGTPLVSHPDFAVGGFRIQNPVVFGDP